MHAEITNRIVKFSNIKWREYKWLQPSDLKKQSKEQAEKLEKSLVENGFAMPFLVWESENVILDGHHRQTALKNLSSRVHVPEMLPAVFVSAESISDAKRLLLIYCSQYADMTQAGFGQFASDLIDIASQIDIPYVDLRGFGEMPFEPEPEADPYDADPGTIPFGSVWDMGGNLLNVDDGSSVDSVGGGLFFDPPFEDFEKFRNINNKNKLVFADGKRAGDAISFYGPPTWIFVWDCVTSWYTPGRPLKRMKMCLWYGEIESYNCDGAHIRAENRTKKTVSNTRGEYEYTPDPRGAHLSDLFSHPITSLHNEGHSYSKPLDWIRCLIANCMGNEIIIYDPCAGSGTSLIACSDIGKKWIGWEIDPVKCAEIIARWELRTGGTAKRIK